MKIIRPVTRRAAIAAGRTTLGGFVAARWPERLPPTYGHLLRMGDTFTYAMHRAVLSNQALVREFPREAITSFPAIGTTDPGATVTTPLGDAWRRQQAAGFADWRLSIEGLVERPRTFSLAELKGLRARSQITRHTCEEGWSAIAEWTGVQLGVVLEAAGLLPHARFLVLHTVDDWVDCMDLVDALHPQTILAYGMNGHDLPVPHGAPVRLRVERQLGYKSLKFLQRIVVTDAFDDGGASGSIQNGWSWYAGI
jgi:DMSO/TMAO reductase YedYZ molybdopterin-dependent catalytic subunit